MKKLILILAIGGLAYTNVHAQPHPVKFDRHLIFQDTRLEILPEDLPSKVKEAILEDEETKAAPVSKAFKVTAEDGTITYELTFGLEEESFEKKYDADGNEIVDIQ